MRTPPNETRIRSRAEDVTDITAEGVRPAPVSHGWARITGVLVLPAAVLLAIVIAVASNGDRILSGFGHNPPPADVFVVERTEFHPGRIEIEVVNPQAVAITPGMITVDDAIVNDFEIEGGGPEIGAREHRTIVFPYEWIQDDPYLIGIVSSSGITTEVPIDAALPAQKVTSRGLAWGALVGLLVGFVPVALGLAWLPALRQLSPDVLAGFLAMTAGLLAFLAVEAISEALDTQAGLIPAVGGAGVVLMGVIVSMVALGMVGRVLRRGATATSSSGALSGMTLSLVVAIGIGLHNLGEGLAIGSSFATGTAGLAIALVIGFMIHNLTEGIGIAAPLAREGRPLTIVGGLGLAALTGLPAILGIWLGRYIGGPLFATLCFALAAGAALQVIVEITRSLRRNSGPLWASPHIQVGFAAGVLIMWSTGILAG